jgi:hypothetical protein
MLHNPRKAPRQWALKPRKPARTVRRQSESPRLLEPRSVPERVIHGNKTLISVGGNNCRIFTDHQDLLPFGLAEASPPCRNFRSEFRPEPRFCVNCAIHLNFTPNVVRIRVYLIRMTSRVKSGPSFDYVRV